VMPFVYKQLWANDPAFVNMCLQMRDYSLSDWFFAAGKDNIFVNVSYRKTYAQGG